MKARKASKKDRTKEGEEPSFSQNQIITERASRNSSFEDVIPVDPHDVEGDRPGGDELD